jgi:sulfonate transport system substrate-binding protein
MPRLISRIPYALLSASVVVAVAGCGSSGSKTSSPTTVASGGSATTAAGGSPATTASSSAIPAGTVLNVGDQEQDLETLFQASGEGKNLPYKINFVEFDSGPLVDAGFAAKRIDLGSMGDLPASVAVSSHLAVDAVAVDLPIGASEYLVAKPGITSIAQLKGQTVAYTTGTAEQAFALRALASAGLTQKDVKQVDVTLQQLGTVIESGNATASVVSVEQKADYLQTHPTAKTLANDITTKPPSYGYLLGAKAALANPAKKAAIADFVSRLIAASTWEKTHQSAWVQAYYVNVQHQTSAEAKVILAAGGTSDYVPVTATVQTALQTVVKLMSSAGAIPATFSVAPIFDPAVEKWINPIITKAAK